MQSITLGLIRHILTSAGGALMTKGVITATVLDQGVGAIITLVGIVWSALEKKSKQ